MPTSVSDRNGSMFQRRHSINQPVCFWFEDHEVVANQGDSIAAALLAAGLTQFRRPPVSGSPRAPYCMIGNCYECLVEIEGQGSVQACLVEAVEGMRVRVVSGSKSEARSTDN